MKYLMMILQCVTLMVKMHFIVCQVQLSVDSGAGTDPEKAGSKFQYIIATDGRHCLHSQVTVKIAAVAATGGYIIL